SPWRLCATPSARLADAVGTALAPGTSPPATGGRGGPNGSAPGVMSCAILPASLRSGGPLFEALTARFDGIVRNLRGQGRLSPDNVRESLRDVRRALLEADVQVSVAKEFVARVEARAVGDEVLRSLTPGQQVVGIVQEELVRLLGRSPVTLAGSPNLPTVVLLAGLQGSGKTTFAGKLARWLKEKGKRSLLASADVYRPAAITPLERVATQAGATFHRQPEGTAPVEI